MTNDPKQTEGMPDDPAGAVVRDAEARQAGMAAADGSPAEAASDGEATALKAEIADLKERLLRAHAEMDNMRKRSDREKFEIHKYAISKFARDIVGIGDNVQRAIEAVPAQAAEQDPALQSLLEGVTLTERELLNVLERHGIKRMVPQGEAFNPHWHQAVMETQDEAVPPGTVTVVLQAGYLIEDRVLRPAMVVVAKGGGRKVEGREGAADQDGAPAAANGDGPSGGDAQDGGERTQGDRQGQS